MTKEEIEKEIEEIRAIKDRNIYAINTDHDYLKKIVDEFANSMILLTDLYAEDLVEAYNKLWEVDDAK